MVNHIVDYVKYFVYFKGYSELFSLDAGLQAASDQSVAESAKAR